MQKKVLIFLLAVCFSAAFLLPITYVLANTNHTHICCSSEMEEVDPYVISLCCVICINVHNAKGMISTCFASGGVSAFYIGLIAYNCPLYTGEVYLHTSSTLIELKVRMDN